MRSVYEVIKRPVISEKSTALAEFGNKYVFEVAAQAKKQEIRDAIERLFSVKVRQVRTSVLPGKTKRFGKFEVKASPRKKAIVTLAEGQKIEFFQTAKS
jgi:large subunit ribosomal protein L23